MNGKALSVFGASFVCCCGLLAGTVVAQHGDKKDHKDHGQTSAHEMSMATPTEHHKKLQPMVGNWDIQWKMFDPASATEPTLGTATAKIEWINDGNFLMEETTGPGMAPGTTFKGIGITGYDTFKNKYVSTWCDNMTHSIMMSTGSFDSAKKTLTMVGEGVNPGTGQPMKTKWIMDISKPATMTAVAYHYMPTGEEFKAMEFTYTRK